MKEDFARVMKEYENKYQEFLNGILTELEWKNYCFSILSDLLEENKDVLIRLKNN
jgi:hypothetical protein